MDDLAAELRMSKKTLYACFPSKSSLVEAVLKDKFNEVERDLSRLSSEGSSDIEEAIHRFLQRVQRHTSEIHPSFVRDLGRESPGLFRIVEHRRRRLIRRHVGALFNKGRKAGLIRRDIPVHLLIEILLGAVEAIMIPSKVTELGLTLERGYSTIIRVILEGAMERGARP
jgi:AcrR family transcriptional regulator